MSFILFGTFILLILMRVPVAVSIGLSSLISLYLHPNMSLLIAPQKMFTAVGDSFPLMAVPFFMVAGALMEKGGISRRLIRVASALVGSFTGGLALVTIMASMFFAAISGSGPATVAAIGCLMIPAMVRQGYSLPFASATQASAGYIGVIIPPSIPMITYGVVTNTSIGQLFMGGFLPGLCIGLTLMIVAVIVSKKYGYKGTATTEKGELMAASKEAVLALLMPVIILGGIYGSVFTPTEAANVAVVYGFLISYFVYKEIKLKDLPEILKRSAISSAMVMLLIATAMVFGQLLTREGIPGQIAAFFINITSDPFVFLMITNVLLLIVGTFMETNAAIIILAPIFFPVIMDLGINPVHFGIVMTINLAIGMITPPLGVNLFVACGITKMKIEALIKANWGYLFASLLALTLLTYFPKITMLLPELLSGAK
ncbi:C4-dicarboxylate ABC transporter permease [Deltaproteobacteria bacterium Smac51]|nr:C4-dicarboxylate ABC transporter permease [Deltaproteobacteria bacterium Smac51]